MLPLPDVRLFIQTVEAGSFSEAARRLGLPPSSVSRRIGALETQLGVQLFYRSTRRMGLTEAGHLYYERTRHILAELDTASRAIADLQTLPGGMLRVHARVALGARLIAPALPDFIARYPGVAIDLQLSDSPEAGLDHGADVAIRFGLGRDSGLIARKITPTRRVMFASPGYLDAFGEPRTADDLKDHNCLGYALHDGPVVWRIKGRDGTREVRASGNFRTNDVGALCAAARGGLGVSVLHEWMIAEDLKARKLRCIMSDHEVTTLESFYTPIYAIYPEWRREVPKLRAFVDFLVRRFEAQG